MNNNDRKERPLESKIALGILMAAALIFALWLVITGLSDLSNAL